MQLQRRDAHLATRTAEARLAVAWLQAAPWCANGAVLIFFVTSVVQKTNHQTNGLYSLALRDPSLPLALSCPGWLQKGLLPIFKNTKKYEKNTTQKYKIRTEGLENTTGWFCIFFCILVPDFQK